MTEKEVYPEPYRNDGTYNVLTCQTTGEEVVMADWAGTRAARTGSISINVHELVDEGEENQIVLEKYFEEFVYPLAKEADMKDRRSRSSSNDSDDNEPILRTRQRS